MPKWMKVMVAIAAIALAAGLYAMSQLRKQGDAIDGFPAGPLRPLNPSNPVMFDDFEFVDQNGEQYNLASINKQITIVAFVFSSCRLACPSIVYQMQRLTEELADTKVRFVCISIDPENDTPEVMRKWATDLAADPARWKFVTEARPFPTGKAEQTARRLMTQKMQLGLKFDATAKVTTPTGGEMDNIIHPTELFLFDPRARLLGHYSIKWPEQVDELRKHARAADKEYRSPKVD